MLEWRKLGKATLAVDIEITEIVVADGQKVTRLANKVKMDTPDGRQMLSLA